MQSYKISLHHLKTSIDGWPIVRNHREFLSCTVTSFSLTGMKIDNSERKGVLENSSSLFPIRKGLQFIPSLEHIFVGSTICSGPCSGSAFKKPPCSAKHFSVCPHPAEINEVHASGSKGIPNFPAFPELASRSLRDGEGRRSALVAKIPPAQP